MWSESKMSDKVFLEKVYLYHRKKKVKNGTDSQEYIHFPEISITTRMKITHFYTYLQRFFSYLFFKKMTSPELSEG